MSSLRYKRKIQKKVKFNILELFSSKYDSKCSCSFNSVLWKRIFPRPITIRSPFQLGNQECRKTAYLIRINFLTTHFCFSHVKSQTNVASYSSQCPNVILPILRNIRLNNPILYTYFSRKSVDLLIITEVKSI